MSHKKKYPVHLTAQGRNTLEQFVARGQQSAREITRARILLFADAGKSDGEITSVLGGSRPTGQATRHRSADGARGRSILDRLKDAPRVGRSLKLDSRVEAKVALLACSAPRTVRPGGRCS